jgi:hypothetical protein
MFPISALFLLSCLFAAACLALNLTYQGVWPQEGATLEAGAMQTALAVSTINLFNAPYTVGSNTTVASLSPATFTGYAAQALTTVPAPVNDPSLGGVSIFIPSHLFTCTTAPTTPETIYGWWLQDTSGKCVAAGNFQNPIVIQRVGDTVPLQITLNFQTAGMTAIANVL